MCALAHTRQLRSYCSDNILYSGEEDVFIGYKVLNVLVRSTL